MNIEPKKPDVSLMRKRIKELGASKPMQNARQIMIDLVLDSIESKKAIYRLEQHVEKIQKKMERMGKKCS